MADVANKFHSSICVVGIDPFNSRSTPLGSEGGQGFEE